MAEELTLRVITPERIVADTPASSVRMPALDGDMGVYPKHAAMVAALKPGVLRYKEAGVETVMFVAGGFAEVRDNTVRVLTSAGEAPEDIDEARAQEALDRARQRLAGSRVTDRGEPIDMIRAESALQRAVMRLSTRGLGGR